MTTKSTLPMFEWSVLNNHMRIDLNQFSGQTTATVAVISEKHGVDMIMNFEKSVNADKFVEFLTRLRQKYPFEKLALFMDRLMVHRSKKVTRKMMELKLPRILNASYSPNFNPIETIFSVFKGGIKKKRLQLLYQGEQEDLDIIIKQQFGQIEKEMCVKVIKKSN